jgi:hypothetical protein
MCQRITCADCGRPSFRGCGRHVESVLGDVPPAARCQCGAKKSAARDTGGGGIIAWMADMLKPGPGRGQGKDKP